jgi:hypothetical protein
MTVDEIVAELRGRIAAAVAEGFSTRDTLAEDFAELAAADYGRDDLDPVIDRLTDEAIEAHRRRQCEWTGPTDCDRLDAAFADLEEHGVVARQHFT